MHSSNTALGRDAHSVPTIREGGGHPSRNWMRDSVPEAYRGDSLSLVLSAKTSRSLGGSLSLVPCIEMLLLRDQGGEGPSQDARGVVPAFRERARLPREGTWKRQAVHHHVEPGVLKTQGMRHFLLPGPLSPTLIFSNSF